VGAEQGVPRHEECVEQRQHEPKKRLLRRNAIVHPPDEDELLVDHPHAVLAHGGRRPERSLGGLPGQAPLRRGRGQGRKARGGGGGGGLCRERSCAVSAQAWHQAQEVAWCAQLRMHSIGSLDANTYPVFSKARCPYHA